jgi:cell division protein FtsN
MSQKTDNLIKLALVFFVSLLSFSIGTYVGKKYSDNQHKLAMLEPKKELPVPKSEEFASDAAELNQAHGLLDNENQTSQQKPVALTDSEVAKIAEEFAAEDAGADEKLVANLETQEIDMKSNPVVKPVVKPVPKQIVATTPATVRPAAATAEERIPASINTKKEISPIHFTVQIGSYPTQTEAEKMTKELQGKGFKTTFVPVSLNGQTWFRVNVGLFGTVKEAQDYKKEFLEKTKLTSAIVQRVL